MILFNRRYRKGYLGESIIIERTYENYSWHDKGEFVPNRITNNQISNRAVVIGNGVGRLEFNLSLLKNHSGLLGEKTVQTYGCNGLYRDFTPDFLVASGNQEIVDELAKSDYSRDNIVFTHALDTLQYPHKFYLIPYDPYSDAGTTAMYLACFDGHKRIYMIGFDGQSTPGYNNNVYAGTNGYESTNTEVLDYKWIADRKSLFDIYSDVDFVWVTRAGSNTVPESWKYATNLRQISYWQFVQEADL